MGARRLVRVGAVLAAIGLSVCPAALALPGEAPVSNDQLMLGPDGELTVAWTAKNPEGGEYLMGSEVAVASGSVQGGFAPAKVISGPGDDAYLSQVAEDRVGNELLTWSAGNIYSGNCIRIFCSFEIGAGDWYAWHAPGGTLSSPGSITALPGSGRPYPAMNSSGEALIGYSVEGAVFVRWGKALGSFQNPVLAVAGHSKLVDSMSLVSASLDAAGEAMLVLEGGGAVAVSFGTRARGFGPLRFLSRPGPEESPYVTGIVSGFGEDGSAVAAWRLESSTDVAYRQPHGSFAKSTRLHVGSSGEPVAATVSARGRAQVVIFKYGQGRPTIEVAGLDEHGRVSGLRPIALEGWICCGWQEPNVAGDAAGDLIVTDLRRSPEAAHVPFDTTEILQTLRSSAGAGFGAPEDLESGPQELGWPQAGHEMPVVAVREGSFAAAWVARADAPRVGSQRVIYVREWDANGQTHDLQLPLIAPPGEAPEDAPGGSINLGARATPDSHGRLHGELSCRGAARTCRAEVTVSLSAPPNTTLATSTLAAGTVTARNITIMLTHSARKLLWSSRTLNAQVVATIQIGSATPIQSEYLDPYRPSVAYETPANAAPLAGRPQLAWGDEIWKRSP